MESTHNEFPEGSADHTTAVPLEIDEATALRAEDLLREFAEDAELETVLVVDRSGALVAGISCEADVTVEIISALVAGASGAMRALVDRLGESGALESLHFGGNRFVYLKETVPQFVLVAVADASRPAGLVRQKALAIEAALAEVLADVPALPRPPRAEETTIPGVATAANPLANPSSNEDSGSEEAYSFDPEPELEEAFNALDLQQALEEDADDMGDPRKVLEPIDFGEPEILIEPAVPLRSRSATPSPAEDGEAREEQERSPLAEHPPVMAPLDAPVFEALEDEDEDEEWPVSLSPEPEVDEVEVADEEMEESEETFVEPEEATPPLGPPPLPELRDVLPEEVLTDAEPETEGPGEGDSELEASEDSVLVEEEEEESLVFEIDEEVEEDEEEEGHRDESEALPPDLPHLPASEPWEEEDEADTDEDDEDEEEGDPRPSGPLYF